MNSSTVREQQVEGEPAMESLGASLAEHLQPGVIVFLQGDLGAGKTTLVRGMLHGAGHAGAVKSPTYTPVEPYTVGGRMIYHFDLYRLKHPEELEFLGIRDYLGGEGICLLEWAERGAGQLPAPDAEITIKRSGAGRLVRLAARTNKGRELLRAFS